MLASMALDDTDRAEIAQMLADASTRSRPSQTPPQGNATVSQGDWDRMGDRDRQAYVRNLVEEHLASLDAEAEREELRQTVKQLRAERAEWEKNGRKGPRPTKATPDQPAAEQTPTLVSKAYTWLFGSATAP